MDFTSTTAGSKSLPIAFRIVRYLLPVTICIGLSWSGVVWNESVVWMLAWCPAVYLIFRKRWFGVALFLTFNPLTIAVFQNARTYSSGGLPYVMNQAPICNPCNSLDPVRRVGRHNGPRDCGFRSARADFDNLARAIAEDMMYCVSGPPPGTYLGPYPTEQEAVTAIASAGTEFSFNGDSFQDLATPSGTARLDGSWFNRQENFYNGAGVLVATFPPPPRWAVWQGQCLIVSVPHIEQDGPMTEIYLIDLVRNKPFCLYWHR